MRCSVTVSIAALIMGMFNVMAFVSFVVRLIMSGVTSEYCGTNSTSSKVMPSPIIEPIVFYPRFLFCKYLSFYLSYDTKNKK